MAYAKMMPDDIKILQAAGQITVIDPNKPLTPDNIKATPEGEKNIENLLTKNLSGKITDTQIAIKTAGYFVLKPIHFTINPFLSPKRVTAKVD